jgi:hypothetical protein
VVTTDLIFSPVTKAVYYSLRLMFIDRLSLDRSFDYCNLVERWAPTLAAAGALSAPQPPGPFLGVAPLRARAPARLWGSRSSTLPPPPAGYVRVICP